MAVTCKHREQILAQSYKKMVAKGGCSLWVAPSLGGRDQVDGFAWREPGGSLGNNPQHRGSPLDAGYLQSRSV